MFFDLDTRELLRTRPNPLTSQEIQQLRGIRTAGPPPRPSLSRSACNAALQTPAWSWSAARKSPLGRGGLRSAAERWPRSQDRLWPQPRGSRRQDPDSANAGGLGYPHGFVVDDGGIRAVLVGQHRRRDSSAVDVFQLSVDTHRRSTRSDAACPDPPSSDRACWREADPAARHATHMCLVAARPTRAAAHRHGDPGSLAAVHDHGPVQPRHAHGSH